MPPDEALAVAEFDGGRGRLIQQSEHRKSGAAERVDGEESLVAVGVGGHAQHDLERFAGCRNEWLSCLRSSLSRPCISSASGTAIAAGVEQRFRPGVFQVALEGADYGPGRPLLVRARRPSRYRRSAPRRATSGGNHSKVASAVSNGTKG